MTLKVKFILCADARTGCHMLQTALNKHPQVDCFGEILNPKSRDTFVNRWNSIESINKAFASEKKCSGFIIHRSVKYPWSVLAKLAGDKNIKVIFIHRRDQMLRYASLLNARKSKKWIDTTGTDTRKEKITFNPSDFDKEVTRYNRFIKYYYEHFYGHNAMQVDYEDMTRDFQKEIQKVSAFLGIRYKVLKPSTHRQEKRSIEEIFTNFEIITYDHRKTHILG